MVLMDNNYFFYLPGVFQLTNLENFQIDNFV